MAERLTTNEIEQGIKRLINFGSVDQISITSGPNTDTKKYQNTGPPSKQEGYHNADNVKVTPRKKKNKWSKLKLHEEDGHEQAPAGQSNAFPDHQGFGEACGAVFVKDQNGQKKKRNKRNKKKTANQSRGDETSENDDGTHVDTCNRQSEWPSILENNNNSRTGDESGGYMHDKTAPSKKNTAGKDLSLGQGAERSGAGIEGSYVLEELKITTHNTDSKSEHGKSDSGRTVVRQKNKKDPAYRSKDQPGKGQQQNTVSDKNSESGNISNDKKQNNSSQRNSNTEIYQHPHSRLRQDEENSQQGSNRNRNPRQDKNQQQSEENERGNFNSRNRERYDGNATGNKKGVQKFWDMPVKKGRRRKNKQGDEEGIDGDKTTVVENKGRSK